MIKSNINKIFSISIPFTDKSFGFYIQSKKRSKKKFKKRNINYRLIIRAELLILAALFVVVGIHRIYPLVPGIKEAITLATTVKPETFTELYFENHTQLPSTATLNQATNFAFTVHNLEYKNMTYPYEVYAKCSGVGCSGGKQIIDQGKIALKHDGYKTISESFTLALPTGRIQVIANLINKNQQISFWVTGTNETVQSQAPSKTAQSQPSNKIIQPTVLTELYFDNQIPLPFTVTANQTVTFAFTVHDFKNRGITYPYEVYLEENGQTTQIDKGQFSLKQNEYKTITESYTLTTPIQLAKIFVKLNSENKYIYFEIKGTE